MADQNRPINLDFARKVFRLLFDAIDILTVEYSSHFKQRQSERNISLVDLVPVFEKGYIKKEFKPDARDSDHRWSLCYQNITVIFKFPKDPPNRIFFKTCWRGNKVPIEEI